MNSNNKLQINLLTILAEDNAQYSADIVRVIEEQIDRVCLSNPFSSEHLGELIRMRERWFMDRALQVPASQKLTVMYVADSIVKNVQKVGNYIDLFGKVIVKCFVHVFETVFDSSPDIESDSVSG